MSERDRSAHMGLNKPEVLEETTSDEDGNGCTPKLLAVFLLCEGIFLLRKGPFGWFPGRVAVSDHVDDEGELSRWSRSGQST